MEKHALFWMRCEVNVFWGYVTHAIHVTCRWLRVYLGYLDEVHVELRVEPTSCKSQPPNARRKSSPRSLPWACDHTGANTAGANHVTQGSPQAQPLSSTIESSRQSNALFFLLQFLQLTSPSDRQCRIQPCMYSSIDQFRWSVLLISSFDEFSCILSLFEGLMRWHLRFKKIRSAAVCCWKQRKISTASMVRGQAIPVWHQSMAHLLARAFSLFFQQAHPKCWSKTPASAFYFPSPLVLKIDCLLQKQLLQHHPNLQKRNNAPGICKFSPDMPDM